MRDTLVKEEKINIRPGVSILGVLRHLNYKPWYALAEFVDNSLQSFLSNENKIKKNQEDKCVILKVEIEIESNTPSKISIRDNAFGIPLSDFPRAFQTASTPPDNSGLSEFGMGMKSAACWFSPKWAVRTSVLNDPFTRSISFDISKIVDLNIHEILVDEQVGNSKDHFTEVILLNLYHAPVKKTIAKIKSHLADIYRVFIRKGILELSVNGEVLKYDEQPVLNAPDYKDTKGQNIKWLKNISFSFGGKYKVEGFAGIRKIGNASKAGFSLFRRGRVILGTCDESYKPSYIFGSSNSFKYQRVFGELHLDGFDVSHTKDGFRWEGQEATFLKYLREALDKEDMPLLKQAEGYRSREVDKNIYIAIQNAINSSSSELSENLPEIIPLIQKAGPVDTPHFGHEVKDIGSKNIDITFSDKKWCVKIQVTEDTSISDWIYLIDSGPINNEIRDINIRVSAVHPFVLKFSDNSGNVFEALLRIAAAIAIAEVIARDSGVKHAGTIRRNVNNIITDAFSQM